MHPLPCEELSHSVNFTEDPVDLLDPQPSLFNLVLNPQCFRLQVSYFPGSSSRRHPLGGEGVRLYLNHTPLTCQVYVAMHIYRAQAGA